MTSPASDRRAQHGFTLLEVLCAFAILAFMTGMMTMNFVSNVDRGTDALAHRELREAADTIFRKMIYEWTEYKDGDSRGLNEEYGGFADLDGWQRDRWAIYRYVLEKKPVSVAGTSPEGGDSLFGDDTGTLAEDETTADDSTSEGDDGNSLSGIELIRLTLKIYREGESSQEPLLTLTTLIDPDRGRLGDE